MAAKSTIYLVDNLYVFAIIPGMNRHTVEFKSIFLVSNLPKDRYLFPVNEVITALRCLDGIIEFRYHETAKVTDAKLKNTIGQYFESKIILVDSLSGLSSVSTELRSNLTDLGKKALLALESGLVWDLELGQSRNDITVQFYENLSNQTCIPVDLMQRIPDFIDNTTKRKFFDRRLCWYENNGWVIKPGWNPPLLDWFINILD